MWPALLDELRIAARTLVHDFGGKMPCEEGDIEDDERCEGERPYPLRVALNVIGYELAIRTQLLEEVAETCSGSARQTLAPGYASRVRTAMRTDNRGDEHAEVQYGSSIIDVERTTIPVKSLGYDIVFYFDPFQLTDSKVEAALRLHQVVVSR